MPSEFFVVKRQGRVGVGTGTPSSSAILELNATDKALLITRLTTAQRDALNAVAGMIIFNTDVNKFQGYTGTTWVDL